ncbi:hypothetical protein [Lactobacillus selangorensis]|nr:hypothetical protein [Lactobacillus selangorensis]
MKKSLVLIIACAGLFSGYTSPQAAGIAHYRQLDMRMAAAAAKTATATTSPSIQKQLKQKMNAESFPKLPTGLNATLTKTTHAFRVTYYSAAHQLALNDAKVKNGTPAAMYSKKSYAKAADAAQQINYFKADQGGDKVKLGHGITATMDRAAGSSYLHWTEDHCSFTIHAVNQEKDNPVGLGKKIVTSLATTKLPKNIKKGAFTFEAHPSELANHVVWQKDKAVYTLAASQPKMILQMITSLA